jgi:hypothetical protein
MRELALGLKSIRCPDGVELVHRDRLPDWKCTPRTEPDWFSYRSERRESVTREAVDLEDALVVRFVNATDDGKRITFLSRFGLPRDILPLEPFEPRNFEPRYLILSEQRGLRALLDRAGRGDAVEAIKAANKCLQRTSDRLSLEPGGRMVWTTESLMSFMFMEIVIAAQNGVCLASCKRCGDLFLTGTLTKRRSTAKYCRDLCRVGAHRANKLNCTGG